MIWLTNNGWLPVFYGDLPCSKLTDYSGMACLVWWFTDEKCWFPLWWKVPIDKNQFRMRRNSLAIVGFPTSRGNNEKSQLTDFEIGRVQSKPLVWVKQCHNPPTWEWFITTFKIGDLRDGLWLFYPWGKKKRVSQNRTHDQSYSTNPTGWAFFCYRIIVRLSHSPQIP